MEKTLHNSTSSEAKKNVSDLIIWGDGDTFKLICKASSKREGWMKSTKAMEIEGVGCVVQVTTQQKNETGMNPYEKDDNGNTITIKTGTVEYQKLDQLREAANYSIAEAVTFVPGVKIQEELDKDKKVISRKLVKM